MLHEGRGVACKTGPTRDYALGAHAALPLPGEFGQPSGTERRTENTRLLHQCEFKQPP